MAQASRNVSFFEIASNTDCSFLFLFWHNPCLQAYIVAAVDENWLIELLKERLKEMRETSDLGLSA
jgi:hypothetical protein